MSNPSINRWGLNLFWYKFWFSDKNMQKIFHQDYNFDKLIYFFIRYGLLLQTPLFFNNYWFSTNYTNLRNTFIKNQLNYFRIIEYRNKVINETTTSKIRNNLKNIFFSRLWILRFQNWLVFNFYSFQPVKINTQTAYQFRSMMNFILNNPNRIFKLRRLKLIFYHSLNSLFHSSAIYNF